MISDCQIEIEELGQVPNPKHQIPNKLPCLPAGRNDPNSKFETKSVSVIGVWNLRLKQRLGWEYGGARVNVGIGV
jgi:hypothetical protein